jgi:hypothetical protein
MSSASASRTSGTHRALSMLGSAVGSSTPTDFQPKPTIGFWELPLMNWFTRSSPHQRLPGRRCYLGGSTRLACDPIATDSVDVRTRHLSHKPNAVRRLRRDDAT